MAFTTMALRALLSTQGGASELAKLVYNQNMTIMCGKYYELISGVINQQTYLGPGAPICNIPYLQFY